MPVNPGVKKGGGGFLGPLGTALGLLGAGAATIATGGAAAPSLGAVLGAAGTGAGLGGAVGGLADKAIDPATGDSQNQGPAISRRAAALDNSHDTIKTGDPSATLQQSIAALDSPDVPEALKAQAAPVLTQAYDLARKRQRGIGTGGIS
jgi:hypothetical protein